MTVTQARRRLPTFAKGLAPEAGTLSDLRQAVTKELSAARSGENPLTPNQAKQLQAFLDRTIFPISAEGTKP